MRYLSVCSGIEAATCAWHPLGWTPVAFSEIEKFPSAVLAHHYPDVPNWGDMTKFKEWPDAAVDVLVGGTPCQSFSVAGLRKGLADPRGNLALTYLALADKYRPEWLVWENVPGVLSADGGEAFGAFLGGLGELGYGWAYRVLDAQYFGVAQRRRRVFVVASLGGWQRAAAVLFDAASLRWDSAPRREAGQGATPILEEGARTGRSTDDVRAGSGIGAPGDPMFTLQAGKHHGECAQGAAIVAVNGADWPADIAGTLDVHYGDKMGLEDQHLYSQRGSKFVPAAAAWLPQRVRNGVAPTLASEEGRGHGVPTIAFDTTQITSAANYSNPKNGDPCHPLASGAHPPAVAVAASIGQRMRGQGDSCADNLQVAAGMQVRRLTPVECARLQGFPDSYLDITYRNKPAADGNKYKALGNSMAVPCMAWIGRRIQQVQDISKKELT